MDIPKSTIRSRSPRPTSRFLKDGVSPYIGIIRYTTQEIGLYRQTRYRSDQDSKLALTKERYRREKLAEHEKHKTQRPGAFKGSGCPTTPIDCDDSPTVEEQGGEQGSLNTPPTSVPASEVGYDPYNLRSLISLLTEACDLGLPLSARNPISASPPPPSPPPPPPAAHTVHSSISENKTSESSDSALKDVGPGPSGEGKENADTGDGHNRDRQNGDGNKRDRDMTATRATSIRASSKRTAGNAGMNQRGEGIPRSGKIRRTSPIDDADDTWR